MDADAVTGPQAKMADRADELTPMMSQYFELCERYDDSLVLFQVGDFYEAFCDAAEEVARLLDITLTQREDSTGEYRMAGVPIDNAETYIEGLLDAGYRVAVADQVEDPEAVTGVVDRAVTRIVTPGTLTEDELLETEDNNYVACLAGTDDGTGSRGASATDGGALALAFMDVSTGECYVTATDSRATVREEIERFDPAEAIVAPESDPDIFPESTMVTPYERRAFDAERARETVAEYFGPARLTGGPAVRATGALLAYAEYARGGEAGHLDYVNRLRRYDPREFMRLDAVALRSLEVFEPRAVQGHEERTLVGVLDETASALGSRRLKDWLRRPLLDADDVAARHDAVAELAGMVRARERLHDRLAAVYDIERLVARVSRGSANARDLLALERTLSVVPDLRDALAGVESERLCAVRDALDPMDDVREEIARAVAEDPPSEITEGGIIAEGYSDELDALRATEREGRAWVEDLEAEERERTGIDSLKVGFNAVHGYYIEVTDPNLDRVPDDYTRRQTLKNAERFYTPELKEREDEILRAEQRADSLEYDLFVEVRESVAAEADRVQALAETLATLDALVSLATVAVERDYCRPEVTADGGFHLEGGRHPVVERVEDRFVPNDAHLDRGEIAVVTGPNMSGKSTYMRQVALAAVMAQAGSFVPAAAARLGVVDRVFTRVGASDDIAGGRSTFMVEMTELAEILEAATADSLVLLDEVGRGTSTVDGLAIARAATEHLHDEVGATTLFATHHHELTGVADALDRASNLHFDADRRGGDIVFDHDVSPGASSSSYGVDVAELAGVPDPVVERSRALLGDDGDPRDAAAGADPAASTPRTNGHGEHDGTAPEPGSEQGAGPPGGDGGARSGDDAALDDEATLDDDAAAVIAELRAASVAETTPMEALQLLQTLSERLD